MKRLILLMCLACPMVLSSGIYVGSLDTGERIASQMRRRWRLFARGFFALRSRRRIDGSTIRCGQGCNEGGMRWSWRTAFLSILPTGKAHSA